MSILFENEFGYFISHKEYCDKLYKNINGWDFYLNENLFHIFTPYKKKKFDQRHSSSEKSQIKAKFEAFVDLLKKNNHLKTDYHVEKNKNALETAEFIYQESGKALIQNSFGCNSELAQSQTINNFTFLFPENCQFFCKDVTEISTCLENKQFDFIILDPPWWNKYIRRKRKKSSDAYNMMYNSELRNIPIESLLKDEGIVVVWCTNSKRNFDELISTIFPKWKIQLIAQWFWIKITQNGEPVCDFSEPPGKQPYEKILLGSRVPLSEIQGEKLVLSIPSAIHSHKPPLIELFKPHLPEKPVCLEIFARYLLPNFTSYGNEVLRLQHESLFTKCEVLHKE